MTTTTTTEAIIATLTSNLKWANDVYQQAGDYFDGVWYYLTATHGNNDTRYTLEREGEEIESWKE